MTRDTTGDAGAGAGAGRGAGIGSGTTGDAGPGVKGGVSARAVGEGSGVASGRASGPAVGVGRRARYVVEWVAVRAVAAVISRLPLDTVRRCGTLLGRAACAVDGWHRRIATDNLAAAFPGRSPEERDAVVRAMFEHFGRLLLELIRFGALDREQMLAAIDTEGEERVWQAYQKGRGVLFFTGHFGYWEMQAIVQPLTVRPVSVLARPLDNPRLDAMLERIRTCTGNAVIYRQGAIRKVLRELGANHGIAMLIDQHLHSPDVVQVDYFGRPVATTSALAALAVRTGAPVIPVFALPLPHGRYRMVFEHPVDPPATDAPDAIREFTQRCTDVLEMYVRRHPELWLWMHRRWREPRPASPDTTSRPDSGSAG